MTNSPGPSPDQIADAASAADIGIDGVEKYVVFDDWERERSGNRFLRLRAEPGREELLVKTGTGWTGEDARRLFDTHLSLADAVAAAHIDHAQALYPLGWIADPPLLVLPYVTGTDLVTIIREPGRVEWDHMEDWMAAAGAMIGAYHRANPADADESEILGEARVAATRMRLPASVVPTLIDQMDVPGSTFASYGDFGPGNLIGTSEGAVFLIDPPVDPPPALFHRDLGNFLFELRRQLAGHGYTRSRPVPGRFESLRRAFLEGYSGALSRADERMVALFEMRRALGMARKRLPGRPGDALWFARLALSLRRQVSDGAQPE